MSATFTKRLTKELRDLQANPPAGISVESAENMKWLVTFNCEMIIFVSFINLYCWYVSWLITVSGAEGTLYEGEYFKLQFTFAGNYPLESPEVKFFQVVFVGNVPMHPH
ncbi:ubiquitin-conjugating enzyme E2 W, partial [Nowakowskiella sp. JEL0078]